MHPATTTEHLLLSLGIKQTAGYILTTLPPFGRVLFPSRTFCFVSLTHYKEFYAVCQ